MNISTRYAIFNRKNLRRTCLVKNYDDNIFMVLTYILDRDSLHVQSVRNYFTEESLKNLIRLYLINFHDSEVL